MKEEDFFSMYVDLLILIDANRMASFFGAEVKHYSGTLYRVVLNGKDIIYAELTTLHDILERLFIKRNEVKELINF